jgi:cytochrome b561
MTVTDEGHRVGARYSAVSIVLHWTIAVLVFIQIWIGGWFEGLDDGPRKGEAFALHLSMGVTIVVLSLARLIWRLLHPAPPLPANYPKWTRILARGTHVLLYVFLIGMPLSGWATASTSGNPLPDVWGAIPWPRLPVSGEAAHDLFETVHVDVLLKGFWVLIVLHIAGALKHQFIDRDGTLWRMLPIGYAGRPETKE